MMKKLLVATALSLVLLSAARAENMLADKIDGKLTLSGNVGYIYNFAGKWRSHNSKSGNSVGYGLSFGYDHKSGFGISSEYLTYTHNYEIGNDSYKVPYHIATFTPSYRINFEDNWYLKVGLGLGFSISSIQKMDYTGTEIADGALYKKTQDDGTCQIVNNGDATSVPQSGVVYVYNTYNNGVVGGGSREITLDFDTSVAEILPNTCITLWDNDRFTFEIDGKHYLRGTYELSTEAKQVYFAVVETVKTFISDETESPSGSGNNSGNNNTIAIDDAGFILAPTLAFGYDDGFAHFDITTKYIHAVKDVLYHGQDGAPNQTQNKGALAFYIGVGAGVNF
ncbi:MAG: hypothetical protein ACR2NY_02845 [Alphaproteobacteria bacterium]